MEGLLLRGGICDDGCVLGKIHQGHRTLGLSFPDFPDCALSARHPLSIRERASEVLSSHIAQLIRSNTPIPAPTEIELPFNESSWFVGFLPVSVSVPDAFVKGWKGN